MSPLAKRLLFVVVSICMLAVLAGAIVSFADFAPDGVPVHRRAEYEAKVASLQARSEMLRSMNDKPHAKIGIDKKTYDFGLMDPHTTAEHTFEIRNEGSLDLFLEDGGTSCKCTVSHVDGRAVKPGEVAYVKLTWNTGYQSEQYEQTSIIRTNDPERPELELKVRGQVRAELVVAAAELPMPATDAGTLVSSSTFLYSQLWDDFHVESATSDLPGFQWSTEPLTNADLPQGDLEAKSAWKFTVSCIPTKVGRYAGEVQLKVVPTSGGEPVDRELTVVGTVRSAISFQDPDLDQGKGLVLGLIRRDSGYERSLIVRVRNAQDRQIEVLDIKPDMLSAELVATGQPGAYRLTLKLADDAAVFAFDREDQHGYVEVGDPNDNKFKNWLPLYGSIINSPSP